MPAEVKRYGAALGGALLLLAVVGPVAPVEARGAHPSLALARRPAKKKVKKRPAAPAAASQDEGGEAKTEKDDPADAATLPAAAPQEEIPAARSEDPPGLKPRSGASSRSSDDPPGLRASAHERRPEHAAVDRTLASSLALSAGIGGLGRRFSYDAPLQREETLARPTLHLGAEVFPFLARAEGWAGLGIGGSYTKSFGKATLPLTGTTTLAQPITDDRVAIELRYALPLGGWGMLVPALGYAHRRFAVDGARKIAPSACTAGSQELCLGRVSIDEGLVGADLRVALGAATSLGAAARFAFGLQVEGGPGTIAAESAVRTLGAELDLGLEHRLWPAVALRLDLLAARYGHSFAAADLDYSSASETYYGLVGGLAFRLP